MHKINIDEIPEKSINRQYMKDVSARYLIVEEFGAPNFEMRYFELCNGANTPQHRHQYEHEVFIVRGKGKLILKDKEVSLRTNDAILIDINEKHAFAQEGEEPFGFICLVQNGVSSSKKEVEDFNY